MRDPQSSPARGVIVACALLAVSGLAEAQDVAIRAGHVVVDPGQAPLRDAWVVIQKGKVAAVGTAVHVPPGVTRVERPQAWIVPGFVDANTSLGLRGELDDGTAAIQPDVDARSRLDPKHRDFEAARSSGVTTALIAPGDANLFSGTGVVVKSTGVAYGRAAKLALAPSVHPANRPPTSRAGAVRLLRRVLTEAHADSPGDMGGALRAFARGSLVGLVTVGGVADLKEFRALQERFGLRLIFQPQTPFTPEELSDLDLRGAFVALRPAPLGAPLRVRSQAHWLTQRGARVLFVSGYPRASLLGQRTAARDAVRAGLSEQDALAGLTSTAAEALGVEGRAGSLERGRDADFVLLDGPPLDLRSRVQAVYVEGRRVFRRAGKETK